MFTDSKWERKYEKRQRYVPKVYQYNLGYIDYVGLKKEGVKLLSFDIDGTLVGEDISAPTEEVIKLFEKLKKEGFMCVLISNNKEKANKFGDILGIPCVIGLLKTTENHLQKALELYALQGVKKSQMAHIGNELVEDIYSGNQLGIITCLVRKAYSCAQKRNTKLEEKEVEKKLKKHGDFYRHHKYEKGDQYYQFKELPDYAYKDLERVWD